MLFLRTCFRFSKQVDRRQILEQYETNIDKQPHLVKQIYLHHRAKIYTTIAILMVGYHYYNLYRVAGTDLIVNEDVELKLSKKVITMLKYDFDEKVDELTEYKVRKINAHIQRLLGQSFNIVVLNTDIPIFKVFQERNMIISKLLIQDLEEQQLISLFLYEYSHLTLRSNAVNLPPNQLHFIAVNRMLNYTTQNFLFLLFKLNQFTKQYFFQQYQGDQIQLSLNFVSNTGYDSEFLKRLFSNNGSENEHNYSLFAQNKKIRALI